MQPLAPSTVERELWLTTHNKKCKKQEQDQTSPNRCNMEGESAEARHARKGDGWEFGIYGSHRLRGWDVPYRLACLRSCHYVLLVTKLLCYGLPGEWTRCCLMEIDDNDGKAFVDATVSRV